MTKGNRKSTKPETAAKPKAERPKQKAAVLADNTAELPTANSKLPTEQMEVHHHPQLEHKHKPWKEYLLEGFMIFIAVMMGFIAENIREGITNNEHARQLTAQLVRDLKDDTAQLTRMINFETGIVNANNGLMTALQQPLAITDIKRIEQLAVDSHGLWPFHPAMGAIGAIKNEVHLKQFSDSQIIGYIAGYEGHIELLHTIQDITLLYQRNYLDPFLRLHFTPANFDSAFSDHPALTTEMRNLTQADLTQLAADMVLVRINTRELLRDSRYTLDDAVKMLKYVNEQYHPE
ncbi:MAG: hypothetical protein ACXVJB_11835 [Mucilaginibacter sp.]